MLTAGRALVLRGDALHLPLPDESVDLIITSPPYFALRSYQDGCSACMTASRPDSYGVKVCEDCGNRTNQKTCHNCGGRMVWPRSEKAPTPDADCRECGGTGRGHYAGQIGSEATPQEFLEALWSATAEMMRVLKPTGSIFVNLGDKYAGAPSGPRTPMGDGYVRDYERVEFQTRRRTRLSVPNKSLMLLPERYRIGCVDRLNLIARAVIVWSKVNSLPESVQDWVRRSHEDWVHLTRQPRYFLPQTSTGASPATSAPARRTPTTKVSP